MAYRYAFIYIRQLTIHLRNAILQQKGKKDSLESVYNWQFVHCANLWTQLLCESHPSETLEPLIYPLVQVTFLIGSKYLATPVASAVKNTGL